MDFKFEEKIFNQGHNYVGAIDEAGRGPLAGPVVAACVLVDAQTGLFRLKPGIIKDSKKLTAKKREEVFDKISSSCREIGVGICDTDTIDKINILEASFLAMKKAIGVLKQKPDYIIVDGKFPIPRTSYKQQAIIQGDNKILSIAAASIIAKVTRDRIMLDLHKKYPMYGFDKHKGYGTKLHFKQLKMHGPCKSHRQSFRPVSSYL
jgi:ribonuclease HII